MTVQGMLSNEAEKESAAATHNNQELSSFPLWETNPGPFDSNHYLDWNLDISPLSLDAPHTLPGSAGSFFNDN